MKKQNNLYKNLYNIDNIVEYTNLVLKNVKDKSKVERFEEYYVENIYKIKDKYVLKILEDIINSTDEEYINKEISKLKKNRT